ncbi:unnamed protein product [Parnassius apollo]|uniref:(apollo) hypothetical protein n=1 Tax=Parnassius apollo TaxID=110799 RepID=A0A8S3WLZ3_PARAO|nr:unnamed protein product [Parnassius apollo]
MEQRKRFGNVFLRWVNRRRQNQQCLLEATVEIISKTKCKRRWGKRYHNIIENYMICSKDIGQSMSEICNDKYVECQDIHYSDDEEDTRREVHVSRSERVPSNLVMHSGYHNETIGTSRRKEQANGGFCENDHGGPMVYGTGANAIVIGVISACLVKERSNKCYGPFLYTSIFKNRQFISCSIYKNVEEKCRRQFRSGETHEEKFISWKNHPDGPAKNELEEAKSNTTLPQIFFRVEEENTNDKVFADGGKDRSVVPSEEGLGYKVFLKLTKNVPAGSLVVFDNFFTSISLMGILHERNIYSVGTVQLTRKGVLEKFTSKKRGDSEEMKMKKKELMKLAPDVTLSVPTTTTSNDIKDEKQQVASKLENTNTSQNEISDEPDEGWEYENRTEVDTRRILYSKRVDAGKRPYMVYLQLTKESAKAHKYRGWLCGGVILSPYYVLTSAACVEDADHFYIVSGTTKFVDSFDYKSDDCVCNHRRKVVWKCVPKNYKFDFQDSIKWSSNDIAIVKVKKPFKLGVKEKGCEFATNSLGYNNVSRDLEKAGTKGYIAGWGSVNNFREGVYRRQEGHVPQNAKFLQEAKVCVMDNEQCAKKWAQKFRSIITQYMICTKDVMKRLSEICDKKYANCTDMEENRRHLDKLDEQNSETFSVDLGRHIRDPDDYTARRSYGGFCENDHGGPLIVKYQGKERVIGVISACKIDPKRHSCHGPFLYTSVFKNRQFISCAIHKDIEETCRRVFRSGITHEEWSVNWDNVDDKHKAELKKEKKDSSDEFSSDDSEEAKAKSNKRQKNSKKVEKAAPYGHQNNKSKHKSGNKHRSLKKEKTESKKQAKHGKSSDRQNKDDVVYESSREENVNEPDNE